MRLCDDVVEELERVLRSDKNTVDERAAALLLLALTAEDGLDQLVMSRSDLRKFAESSLPVVDGVAVLLETKGLSSKPAGRSLINNLIEAQRLSIARMSAQARQSPGRLPCLVD